MKLRQQTYSPGNIIDSPCALNSLVGPYAELLKRWAECVSRPELRVKSIEEYHTMKDIYDGVLVLRYSDLLKELEAEDREAFALMKKLHTA